MTFRLLAFASALALCAAPAWAQHDHSAHAAPAAAAPDAALTQAVASAHRSPENVARDAARHPAETLAFFGLKPGQTVLELNPGGGYWTEILAPYAKATGGRYIATGADLKDPQTSVRAKEGRARFEAKFADAAKWGKIELADFGAASGPLAAPNSVDMAFTARNVHNWMDADGRVDKVFAALKPGGTFGVEEHRADPRPMAAKASDGYVSEAFVIEAAKKAGFELDARSEVNANPKDTKDHPFGVWTLAPNRNTSPYGQPADPKFDRSKYDRIGESDRMTLRFRKPG